MIRLHANENPLGPCEEAVEAVRTAMSKPVSLTGINRYPDFLECELRSAIASKHFLSPLCVVPCCGASEIIGILPSAFLNKDKYKAVIPSPCDPLVLQKIKDWGMSAVEIPLNQDFEIDLNATIDAVDDATGFIFFPNPVDPSGTITEKFSFTSFMTQIQLRHPDVIVVVDESFREYIESWFYPDHVSYIHLGFNILVLKSFSYAYGLAGLGAGYGLSKQDIASILFGSLKGFLGNNQGFILPEGDVNRLAEASAIASLKNGDSYLEKVRTLNSEGLDFLVTGLRNLSCKCSASSASFIFSSAGQGMGFVPDELAKMGILVKHGSDYGENWKDWFRVSVATMDENRKFLEALEEILKRRNRS